MENWGFYNHGMLIISFIKVGFTFYDISVKLHLVPKIHNASFLVGSNPASGVQKGTKQLLTVAGKMD